MLFVAVAVVLLEKCLVLARWSGFVAAAVVAVVLLEKWLGLSQLVLAKLRVASCERVSRLRFALKRIFVSGEQKLFDSVFKLKM